MIVLVQLLVLGGEVFITGCTFLNVNPFAMRFPVFMGGDVSNQLTPSTQENQMLTPYLSGRNSSSTVTCTRRPPRTHSSPALLSALVAACSSASLTALLFTLGELMRPVHVDAH